MTHINPFKDWTDEQIKGYLECSSKRRRPMEDLEKQDEHIERLRSFYEEDFDALSDRVWDCKSTGTPVTTLEFSVDNILNEFSITCKEVYQIDDPSFYFELLLAEYDLPSLLEFSHG